MKIGSRTIGMGSIKGHAWRYRRIYGNKRSSMTQSDWPEAASMRPLEHARGVENDSVHNFTQDTTMTTETGGTL